MSKGIEDLDFFRRIAIISVMLIHISSACRVGDTIPSSMVDEFRVINILGRYAVSGFIIITGFFLQVIKK